MENVSISGNIGKWASIALNPTTMLSLLPDIPIELTCPRVLAAAVLGPLQTLELEIDIQCTWT
jgi:hypothetical protein